MDPWNDCTLSEPERDACTELLKSVGHQMRKQLLWVDALLLTSFILAGVIVGIGACGRHYRHRPFTSFIYLGATLVFLPVISRVVSITNQPSNIVPTSSKSSRESSFLIAQCYPNGGLALIWVFLYVQNILINTSTVVAMDIREGPNMRPPLEFLTQIGWAVYLGTLYLSSVTDLFVHYLTASGTLSQRDSKIVQRVATVIATLLSIVAPFALTFGAKILLKYYAFRKAQQSFEFGQNPLVVSGYMQQLQQKEITNQHGDLLQANDDNDASSPPPLLVTGEERGGHSMEMKPSGYVFKDGPSGAINNNTCSLVTLDRVWQQYKDSSMLHALPISTRPQQLKDLCMSFALFKLLRCRFARYNLTNAGSTGTLNFIWSLLLKDGQHARVFGVLADELSFVNDYYNSSFTISYSKPWLPILNTVVSLLSCIIYSFVPLFISNERISKAPQFFCESTCIQGSKVSMHRNGYGIFDYFVWVPAFLFFTLVIITEVKDMVSYICSNWTKIVLICRTTNIPASQQQHSSPRIQKCVSLLLRCRCKLLLNHWDGKMGQCSVLAVTTGSRTTSRLCRYLLLRLGIPDRKRRVKVPEAVQVCIITTLRSSASRGRRLSNIGTSSLGRTQDGERLLWACNGEGTCDTILTWHIATCIFEVKDPYQRDQEQEGSPPVSYSDHKTVAIYLSRYCVYLVAKFPELLPDNDVWIKSLYKAVNKDVEHALAGHVLVARSSKPEDDYQRLVDLLTENSQHAVLKNGVKLGMQMVETINDEETAWKLLADFWSEMILYVAPSDNLKGHSDAIARGGELITLLWALLFHAGIVSRPGEEDGAAAASSGAV